MMDHPRSTDIYEAEARLIEKDNRIAALEAERDELKSRLAAAGHLVRMARENPDYDRETDVLLEVRSLLHADRACPSCASLRELVAALEAERDELRGELERIPKDVLRWIQTGGELVELMGIVGGLDAALADRDGKGEGDE